MTCSRNWAFESRGGEGDERVGEVDDFAAGADAAIALRALDAGARLVTHLFNAMGPLTHRAPGLAGVALTDPRVLPCVIADGRHVDPIVLRLIGAAASDRVVLVSDASAAAAAVRRSAAASPPRTP